MPIKILNIELSKNKSTSGKKINVSFSKSDSPIVTLGYNFFIDSDLFLSLMNIVGQCSVCVAAIDIELFYPRKWALRSFLIFQALNVIGKFFFFFMSAVDHNLLQEKTTLK